jgi:hypothetical protein
MKRVSMILIAAVCLGMACCELQLKTEMTVDDLHGFPHMNDLIVNTLNIKKPKVLGEFPMRGHISWDYKAFEVSRQQVELAHSYITTELGFDFETVKEELQTITSQRSRGIWMIFVSLPAAVNGATRPTTVFIKWCERKRHFDILILNSKDTYPSEFTVPHLIRFSSRYGFEVGEPTLIKERSSEFDQKIVGGVAHKILISAIEHLAYLRGVHPKAAINEVNFRNHKSHKHKLMLGLDPITTIFIAALVVQAAAKLWGVIAQIFSTKITTKLVAHFRNSGFKSYSLKATVRRNYDIWDDEVDDYADLLTSVVTKMHPNKAKKTKISAAIAMCTLMDKNTASIDGDIDTGSNSADRFFSIMSHRNAAGNKYTFMSMNMDATFVLAPDLLIYKRSRSFVGGIYADEQSIIEERPREVTSDDLKALRAFSLTLALKLFSDDLNVPNKKIGDFPPMPK